MIVVQPSRRLCELAHKTSSSSRERRAARISAKVIFCWRVHAVATVIPRAMLDS
jgi:hypothetical protein